MKFALCSLAAAAALTLTLSGCNVSNDKHGDNDNVHVGTPFGSMNIKTNDNADTSAIGISLYPGAKVYHESGKTDDSSSADVNLSFGDFKLGVHAASYITPDSQDKVLAFYKKDLATRYGDVITCRGSSTVGSPERTSQGLTCGDKDKNHISTDDNGDDLELRAGAPQHQHIVGVTSKDGGTRIGLVALELPSHLGHHDGDTPQ